MKINWIKKAWSFVLAGAMVVCLASAAAPPARVYAEESGDGGKYVSDVFISYGKSEEKAAKWLTDNGWEPVKGDFNAGKASFFDDNKIQDQNVAAVMGIKRTNDKNNAVTDMAVMNMKGGYSIPDYENLLAEKKAEIGEFINNFKVVIEEYRSNLNSEDNKFGKTRAKLAHDMLNKFYDGDPDDEAAVNDTGKSLGDLFAEKTRQEGNDTGGDLEQIMLESSGPAMLVIETFLALGADDAEDTWLERASGLTGDELSENLPRYVPEAEGQDIPPSAVSQYLGQQYGDTAMLLCDQWQDVHDEMVWFEGYNEENGLWPEDNEDDDTYKERLDSHFKALTEEDETAGKAEMSRHGMAKALYYNLYEIPYAGDWGETLGDFFNPAEDDDYSSDSDAFLPLAAALSEGQRASLDFLSLQTLLLIGFGDEAAFELALPDINELFGDATEMSVYTGVNRAAFRGGVAITSEALMEQNAGKGNAFNQIWDNTGIVAVTSYAAAALSVTMIIAGGVMAAKGYEYVGYTFEQVQDVKDLVVYYKNRVAEMTEAGESAANIAEEQASLTTYETKLQKMESTKVTTSMGTAGRWMLGIGGAILVGAAIVKAVQMYKYYQRDMTPIPRMIVDESDIVTYLTDDNGNPILDEKGNQKKNIDFKTYEYYTAVKCNRPEVGEIGDWQDGVSDYKDPEYYCFDIADLNADMGQEWIALYTVKSQDKGDPILADSLTLQYGSNKAPKGCTKGLHLFTYTNAVDLGDTAWAFNNDKKGVYFFWDEDTNAFAAAAASAFGAGQLALAGFGGLILGILGATLVLTKKRRKDEPEAA